MKARSKLSRKKIESCSSKSSILESFGEMWTSKDLEGPIPMALVVVILMVCHSYWQYSLPVAFFSRQSTFLIPLTSWCRYCSLGFFPIASCIFLSSGPLPVFSVILLKSRWGHHWSKIFDFCMPEKSNPCGWYQGLLLAQAVFRTSWIMATVASEFLGPMHHDTNPRELIPLMVLIEQNTQGISSYTKAVVRSTIANI